MRAKLLKLSTYLWTDREINKDLKKHWDYRTSHIPSRCWMQAGVGQTGEVSDGG